jgi:hypothetical protein
VTGNIDEAIDLMGGVVNRYPKKKVMQKYNRLLMVKKDQERLAEQLK